MSRSFRDVDINQKLFCTFSLNMVGNCYGFVVKLFKGQFSSFSHSLGLVLNGCDLVFSSYFFAKRESLGFSSTPLEN